MVYKKFDIAIRLLFLGGLVFFLAGQILLAKVSDFIYNQEPIGIYSE